MRRIVGVTEITLVLKKNNGDFLCSADHRIWGKKGSNV